MTDDFDYKVFGIKLKEARKQAGYTQMQLADMMGVSLRYYSALESGTSHMSFQRFIQFLEITQASPAQLLTGCKESFGSFIESPMDLQPERAQLEKLLDSSPNATVAAMVDICATLNKHFGK